MVELFVQGPTAGTATPPAFAPGGPAPVSSGTAGDGAADPGLGRRGPDMASAPTTAADVDAGRAAPGVLGSLLDAVIDLLGPDGGSDPAADRRDDDDDGVAARSDMVEGSDRLAARRLLLAEALHDRLQDPRGQGYTLGHSPGSAPEVQHVGPPVRLGTILDIVA